MKIEILLVINWNQDEFCIKVGNDLSKKINLDAATLVRVMSYPQSEIQNWHSVKTNNPSAVS